MLYFQQYFYISSKIKKKKKIERFQNVLYRSIFCVLYCDPCIVIHIVSWGPCQYRALDSKVVLNAWCYNFGGGQWRRHFLWICWLLSQTGSSLAGMLSWVCQRTSLSKHFIRMDCHRVSVVQTRHCKTCWVLELRLKLINTAFCENNVKTINIDIGWSEAEQILQSVLCLGYHPSVDHLLLYPVQRHRGWSLSQLSLGARQCTPEQVITSSQS